MNYEYLKKCVGNSPVTPMSIMWWDSIIDLVPDHLIQSPNMTQRIQDLHDEVLIDYDKSIRKSMGNFS